MNWSVVGIIIGFVTLGILVISNLVVIGKWIGSNNTANVKRDDEIKELKDSNTKIWIKLNDMSGQLHDFEVIHLALTTQNESLKLLTATFSEHIKNPPFCPLHYDMVAGASRRDEQTKDLQRQVDEIRTRAQ